MRSIYADWERGDFSHVEWADLDIEWTLVDGLSPGTWRGLAGMATTSALGGATSEEAPRIEYRELDDERVLVLQSALAGAEERAESRSGATTDERRDISSTSPTARSAKLVLYSVRDRALSDLGLED